MRHDPAIASIVIMLRELKVHGIAHAVNELAERGAPAFEAAQPTLAQLLKAETAEREVRSVAYQLKVAKFPAYRARPTSPQPGVYRPSNTTTEGSGSSRWWSL